jgi:hypothetical protein
MQALIWGGSALTLVGVVLLGWCMRLATQARQIAAQDDAASRAILQRVIAWNMAAMAIAGLGLTAVILGLVLR